MDRFFELLKADPRDIMPNTNHPYFTYWETKDRVRWGWSTPGWRNPGEPAAYAVRNGG